MQPIIVRLAVQNFSSSMYRSQPVCCVTSLQCHLLDSQHVHTAPAAGDSDKLRQQFWVNQKQMQHPEEQQPMTIALASRARDSKHAIAMVFCKESCLPQGSSKEAGCKKQHWSGAICIVGWQACCSSSMLVSLDLRQ